MRKFEKRTLNKKLLSMILLVKNKVMLQKKILFVFILNFNKLFFQLQKKIIQFIKLFSIKQKKFYYLFNKNNYFFLKKKLFNMSKTKRLIPAYLCYKKLQSYKNNLAQSNLIPKKNNFMKHFINNLKSVIDTKKPYFIFLTIRHLSIASIFNDKSLKKQLNI